LGVSQIFEPDGGVITEYYAPSFSPAAGQVYKTERADGSVIERIWQQSIPPGTPLSRNINPYIKTEFTSVKDAGGNLVKTAIKDYKYDQTGCERSEYFRPGCLFQNDVAEIEKGY
jgi:hypothetical protein